MLPSNPRMTSLSFQIFSEQEVLAMKRNRGIMACAECQRRKLKCDRKFPCSSCVRRGKADICPTGDLGPIGRGRRVVRSESKELSKTIHRMGGRIRELEGAVAEAHAGKSSATTHPLLREHLLSIKNTAEISRASSPLPTQLDEAPSAGALAFSSAPGTARYYGPTAGPSALFSAQGSGGSDRAEYAAPFADLVKSFPFDKSSSSRSTYHCPGCAWDTGRSLEALLFQLPDQSRAWALYDIYVAAASWYGAPITIDDMHELVAAAYAFPPNSALCASTSTSTSTLTPHALAVLFLALALGALADTSLPPYSADADALFDAGRAALALSPVFGSTDVRTIQALALAGLYHATGGSRYSIDSSWTLTSMAVGLALRLRLHRESAHSEFEKHIAERRRALFWELYSLETYQSLSFARPLTIHLSEITCEFPVDTEKSIDDEGNVVPGFLHTKWRFTKEITAPMAEVYTRAGPPTYGEVLDLDRRLRHFMETGPFSHYLTEPDGSQTFRGHVRAHLILRFCGNLMVYIHRSSFVQALKDKPDDPLSGPYAASFLAAYRGASLLIKSDLQSFKLYPQHLERWWPIWKSLVNAAFVVGSIVSKSPGLEIAPTALKELHAAVELVEHGASLSFLAAGSLPVLLRLRNTATAIFTALRPQDAAVLKRSAPPNLGQLADDRDLELLGGSRALLGPDPVENRDLDLIGGSCAILDPVSAPCPPLPNIHPQGRKQAEPPATSEPFTTIPPTSLTSDQAGGDWVRNQMQPDTLDPWLALEELLSSATRAVPPGDGLEAYLAAQIQGVPYPQVILPELEMDWESFVLQAHS